MRRRKGGCAPAKSLPHPSLLPRPPALFKTTNCLARRYEGIPKVVSAAMDAHMGKDFTQTPDLETILGVDAWARAYVKDVAAKKA